MTTGPTNLTTRANSGPEPTAPLSFALGTPVGRLEFSGQVPTGRVHPLKLLPQIREISDRAVALSVRHANERGQTVSCGKGCAACCRQVVPISETEALALAELVAGLPEPRQSVIRARFAEARTRLAAAGLLEPLADPASRATLPSVEIGLRYFELGIACPFLEEESCSIHPNRPVACREFLVSSPAANCSAPSADNITAIPMLMRASDGIRRLTATASAKPIQTESKPSRAPWVALVLSLDWAAEHASAAATVVGKPGGELLREFVEAMIRAASVPPSTGSKR